VSAKVTLTVCVLASAVVLGDARRAEADPTAPLRLEDVVQLALSRNERGRIADLNVTVASAAVARARSAFLPVLAASGNDQIRSSGEPRNVATGQITISQPLLDPSAFPLYAQSRELLDSARYQSVDDKRQLAFDAARAFFTVLLADEVVIAAQRKLETAQANLADTQARAEAQLASSNDVTRARVDLASSTRELQSDQGTLESDYLQLAFIINAPAPKGLAPPTALLDAGQRPLPAIDELVKIAIARRPDIVARRHAAVAAHDFALEPLLRLAPSLGVSASVNTTSNTPASGQPTEATLEFSASWTLFDAGVRYADRRSRLASAAIADLTTNSLVRSVETEVRSSVALLVSSRQALAAAQQARDASRQSSVETEILYRQGLAKAIELVDANEQRFIDEVNSASAEFSVASAYLGLRQALGLEPIGTELK
jgi:outer membrane protein TolC